MPRRRSITCHHCGFLQLKRDNECEQCGRITARAKSRLVASLVSVAMSIAVGAFIIWRLQVFGVTLGQ